MKRITYILMLLLIVLLTACSHISPSLSNADGGVTKAMAEQVEYDMSYDEVLELLGPTGDIGSGTIVQEYMLSDGGTAYFSYTIYPDNVFRVTHIRIVDPGESC